MEGKNMNEIRWLSLCIIVCLMGDFFTFQSFALDSKFLVNARNETDESLKSKHI